MNLISRPQIQNLRFRNQASESTQLRVTRVFFPSQLSHNTDNQSSSNFHSFVIIDAYVEIHRVRILVFDNYQQCPVSLKDDGFACRKQLNLNKNSNNFQEPSMQRSFIYTTRFTLLLTLVIHTAVFIGIARSASASVIEQAGKVL